MYNFAIRILCLGALSLFGCASTASYDGFASNLKACYAYIYGNETVGIDYAKAMKWCSLGDIEGSNSSTTLLAELFYFGHGIPSNLSRAATFYEKAAATGHPHAQVMVYVIYNQEVKDKSTQEQKELGLMYLNEAAEDGYEKAMELLAHMSMST